MADLNAVLTGLAAPFRTLGFNVYEKWSEQVTTPAVMFHPPTGVYEQAFGPSGDARMTLTVEAEVLVSLAGGIGNAQAVMNRYLSNTGANSIRAAIALDRTLGGNANYALCHGWRDYDTKVIGGDLNPTRDSGVEYLGATMAIEVDVS